MARVMEYAAKVSRGKSLAAVSKENPDETANEVDEIVDKILSLYPQYESLYVDSNGFVFTEGTSKAMRGNAKLYKNKYFKK